MIDREALTYLYYMQNTSNMLTGWTIALQKFDFTLKHVPGKLSVVPDTLSCQFGVTDSELISQVPAPASTVEISQSIVHAILQVFVKLKCPHTH